MAKPYSFRHKHGRALHAIQGPWIVEGPGGFSFELLDRTDAALLAKKLNDAGEPEAAVLAKRLSEPRRSHHATKKSPAQLQREIDEALHGSVAAPTDFSSSDVKGEVSFRGKPVVVRTSKGWTPIESAPSTVGKAVREAIFSLPDDVSASELRREIVSRL